MGEELDQMFPVGKVFSRKGMGGVLFSWQMLEVGGVGKEFIKRP